MRMAIKEMPDSDIQSELSVLNLVIYCYMSTNEKPVETYDLTNFGSD